MNVATATNIFLAIVTAIYAFLTFRILKVNSETVSVMREQFRGTTRPYVVIDVFSYPGIPIFKLRIRNLGNSAAENLRLNLDKNFFRFGIADENLRECAAFASLINVFAPKSELLFDLGVSHEIYKGDSEMMPLQFTIVADYCRGSDRYVETSSIDLNALKKTAANPEPDVDALREINKTLEKYLERALSTNSHLSSQ